MDTPWNVLCFSSVEWRSHPRRSHHVMKTLVGRGASVLYVENLGTRLPRLSDAGRVVRRLRRWAASTGSKGPAPASPRIRVDSPVVLPLQHLGPVRDLGRATLVRRLRRRLGPRRPLVVWTYLPMPVIRDVAGALGADALVYDWCDDASAHVLSPSRAQRARIARWEDEMAAGADVTFVASASLLESRGSANPNTFVIPHGGPGRARVPRGSRPEGRGGEDGPTVGFVGSITRWTDLDLLDHMARERPHWRFVMVGPVKTRVGGLGHRPNVVFTGERPHEEIPGYLSSFDVGIIPYRVTPATTAASPLKLREYLAAGLPVVSVDVPEVRPFAPGVQVAEGPAQFLAAIERALEGPRAGADPGGSPSGPRRAGGSWEERVDEMIGRVTEVLEAKRAP